jgi:hypothetical protein
MIDATRTGAIPEMLALGRQVNASATAGHRANGDQRLAALEDCLRRLGVPLDRQTALAYALGVRHALDRMDDLLPEDEGTTALELELYARVALLHDAAAGRWA